MLRTDDVSSNPFSSNKANNTIHFLKWYINILLNILYNYWKWKCFFEIIDDKMLLHIIS